MFDKTVDVVQERSANLKDDLQDIREDLPELYEKAEAQGRGFFAALKRFFTGK